MDKIRWSRLIHGFIGIVVGMTVFLLPWLTHIQLVTLFSGYVIVTGILQTLAALELHKIIVNEELVLVSGLISIIVGALLMIRPMDSLSDLVTVIGILCFKYGIIFSCPVLEIDDKYIIAW